MESNEAIPMEDVQGGLQQPSASTAGVPFTQNTTSAALLGGAPVAIETERTIPWKPSSERKSFQLRALARKSVSYQRRQLCSTCCCVALCPLFMVLICGILGIVVTGLIDQLVTSADVQYCSNANASDPNTLLPLGIRNAPNDTSGPVNRTLLNVSPSGPCVQWFGHDYPTSLPYSPPTETECPSVSFNPNVCPLPDTTLLPAPPTGWLTSPPLVFQLLGIVATVQKNFWGVVAFPPALGAVAGERPKPSPVNLGAIEPLVSNVSTSGFLGGMRNDFYLLPTNSTSLNDVMLEARPYFNELAYNQETIDDYIRETVIEVVEEIAQLSDPDPLRQLEPTDPLVASYRQSRNAALNRVPYGALILETLGPDAYNYIIQAGTNRRLAFSSTGSTNAGGQGALRVTPFPTEGLRRLLFQSRMSQAIMEQYSELPNATITQGLRIFPQNDNSGFSLPIASFIGQILYPFGVSFLLPLFVLALVKDKEERVLIMMKMNGLKMWAYWLTEYVVFYVLHIIATVIFIITGVLFQLEFFVVTDPGVYILLFFLWGHVQIALAFLLSSFFSKSRTALLTTYLLVVLSIIINVAITDVFSGGAPLAYFVYPPFAFYRAIIVVNRAAFSASRIPYSISMLTPGDEVFAAIIAMLIAIFVLFLLAWYLSFVLPTEYGVRRPWYFPVADVVAYLRRKRNTRQADIGSLSQSRTPEVQRQLEEDEKVEDEDVVAEKRRVEAHEYPDSSSLVMYNMRKAFSPTKMAVKGVSLAVDSDVIFGLLGPNGAGKTTLINILTGLFEMSDGQAMIDGYRVGPQMRDVYMSIGVCPQHDILWGDLTVEDHLLFYARLKGIPPNQEAAAVTAMLENMGLRAFRHRQTKGLSGGEKRRVSIAIALIGGGKVIFLDEPTTGLDPEVRRLIWEIINRQRIGKTIILTTHSMEEAEVLCQRIGIMAKGQLRCLGTPLHLKNKYGQGFKLSISCRQGGGVDSDTGIAEHVTAAQSYVEKLLPAGFKRLDSFAGNLSYEFPYKEDILPSLFEELGARAHENGIVDWGISQTSLEEVFLRIVREADAEAE